MAQQSSTVRVRLATEADLPRIVTLLDQLAPGRENLGSPTSHRYRAALGEVLADSRQRLLVVEADGAVAGTACLIIVPNVSHQGKPYALVENVVVDETQRSAGHGELLMRRAIAEAQRAGCYKLTLTSNKGRAGAHRFYQRLGFRAASEGFRIDF